MDDVTRLIGVLMRRLGQMTNLSQTKRMDVAQDLAHWAGLFYSDRERFEKEWSEWNQDRA